MNTAYPTFTGRSKSVRLTYGITNKQAESLKAIGQATKSNSTVKNLFDFTSLYVKHARDLAKSGFKDEARNWSRFFENSQILSFLETIGCTGDLKLLREELGFLHLECHPMEPENFTTDIEAIRHCLTEILSYVKQTPLKPKIDRPTGTGRAPYRLHGHRKHFPQQRI